MNRLRILFYVPSQTFADPNHKELTERLAQCLSDRIDVQLVVSTDKKTSTAPADYDLIHIFGCWSISACQLARKAYVQHTPYLLTPLGALQPWEGERHRRTPLYKRQRIVTEKAAAVQVCGQLEQTTFLKLNWNQRVALIKNPVLTSLTTFEEAANQLLLLYRKVLDSYARVILDDSTRQLIGNLLQVGLDDEALDDADRRQALIAVLSSLSDEEWRRISLYASEEGISLIIEAAVKRLGLDKPMVDVTQIDRFKGSTTYSTNNLRGDILLSRNLLLRNKVKETFAEHGATEQSVSLQLLNLHYELSHHAAPLLHLANLYHTMRYTDMDEDMIRDMARDLDILDFAERLMAVMHHFLGLTEGFMPFNSRNDKQARQLTTALTKFGVYPV